MFANLPEYFREYKLSVDVRTLLLLRKAFEKGLINTLGDIFQVLKGIVVKEPADIGPFSTAFYAYFLDVRIRLGERLDNAIARSEAFRHWLEMASEEMPEDDNGKLQELIDRFLDEVHLTSYDIQKLFSGEDILNKDNPDRPDTALQDDAEVAETRRMADYRDISLEELRKRMERVARQQKRRHEGGSHWIGQGGYSPYGNNGAAMGGIRAGGTGGGGMARQVIGNSQFYPVDRDGPLRDDNMDAALAALRGIEDETAERLLDVPETIKQGLKEGGLFLPYEKEKTIRKVQVVLMIDNGGYSMYPYIRQVTQLFSKMKTRFAHDLKVYYFHNTIYGGAYSDVRRTHFIPLKKLLSLDKQYALFIVGDADMAPYELSQSSLENWAALQKKFKKTAWLNPEREEIWHYSTTIQWIKTLIPMYKLSPNGIEKAVLQMNRKYV